MTSRITNPDISHIKRLKHCQYLGPQVHSLKQKCLEVSSNIMLLLLQHHYCFFFWGLMSHLKWSKWVTLQLMVQSECNNIRHCRLNKRVDLLHYLHSTISSSKSLQGQICYFIYFSRSNKQLVFPRLKPFSQTVSQLTVREAEKKDELWYYNGLGHCGHNRFH